MKFAHKVTFNVFIKPEDVLQDPSIEEKLENCLYLLVGFSKEEFAKEKIFIEIEKVEGFNNRTIKIMRLTLNKDSIVNSFMKRFLHMLNPDQKDLLYRQKESRLDEELNFFIRLGKQELLRSDIYITESGDCMHMKIAIAAFPKKKDAALNVVTSMLKGDSDQV